MGLRVERRTWRHRAWWAVAGVMLLAGMSRPHAQTSAGSAPLTISAAWVRPAPAAGGTSAAYMQIENRSSRDVTVSRITSDAAEVVEAHRMRDENGLMRMEMLARLVVPAQGRLTLEPGGLHLMLVKLHAPLRAGQTVPIVFHLADAPAITIAAPVRDTGTAR